MHSSGICSTSNVKVLSVFTQTYYSSYSCYLIASKRGSHKDSSLCASLLKDFFLYIYNSKAVCYCCSNLNDTYKESHKYLSVKVTLNFSTVL